MAVVRGDKETELSFKVSGLLERIGPEKEVYWQEGAMTASNQVLAQLVQADFLSASNSALAKFELDKKLLERGTNLLSQKVISPNELDVLEARFKESQAAFDQAKQSLSDSQLRAPYAGRILARVAEAGETIQMGKPVLRIGDLTTVTLELGVPDYLVSHIHTNDEKRISISSLEGEDRTLMAKVTEVGVAAKQASRLFKVILKVANPGERIKSGMTANVYLDPPPTDKKAVLIPLSALISNSKNLGDGHLAVFVFKPDAQRGLSGGESRGKAHERPVMTDEIIGSSIVVTSGLTTNDLVIVSGLSNLADGSPVAVRDFSATKP
jgi:RND family efflux transporter MFP subunit